MSEILNIRRRLRGVHSIRKVTQAMETMAIARLKKIQRQHALLIQYQERMNELVPFIHIETAPWGEIKTHGNRYVVFLSNSGFCGNFNRNLLNHVKSHVQLTPDDDIVLLGNLGSKFKRFFPQTNVTLLPYSQAELACQSAIQQAKSIHLVYNHFVSLLNQKETIFRIYPWDISELFLLPHAPLVFMEPSPSVFREKFFEVYLRMVLEVKKNETALGELYNRFLSMKNANENASVLIEELTVHLNKMRQTEITQQLSEVINAFEVMRRLKAESIT